MAGKDDWEHVLKIELCCAIYLWSDVCLALVCSLAWFSVPLQKRVNTNLESKAQQSYNLSNVQGRVALLGDSAHAMQPNLGQGGCMAIEDGYQLAVDLSEAVQKAETSGRSVNIEEILIVRRILPPYRVMCLLALRPTHARLSAALGC